jgi:hypothetical protein
MRRQPRADGVGDEDPPKVVGAPLQRLVGGGDPRGLRCGDEALSDVAAGEWPVLGAEAPFGIGGLQVCSNTS